MNDRKYLCVPCLYCRINIFFRRTIRLRRTIPLSINTAIDRFLQYSLNLGERPTKVLHFDIKTDPYKSALPKITQFENGTKKHNLDTKWPKSG